MTDSQIIVLATPVFLLLMAMEVAVGLRRCRNTFLTADTLGSVGLGVMSQVVNVLTKSILVGLYALVHQAATPWAWPVTSWVAWLVALVLYDFCYYWHHRFGHTVAVLWAAHAVHHQSEHYNLSTALRQTSTGWLFGWVFYLPMALLGVPPLMFAVVALVDLLYQYWVHTEHIGRLGWFDRWFCSPSNHRVHHAVNDVYLDRNYGGILVAWDRLFGTFQDELEAEPCVYGTRSPLRSLDPLRANLQVYADLLHDARHAGRWQDKIKVWLMPPGWGPDDLAARFPKSAFDLAARAAYRPLVRGRGAVLALALFAGLLAATSAFLWVSHTLSPAALWAGAAALVAWLWGVGVVSARACNGPAPVAGKAGMSPHRG